MTCHRRTGVPRARADTSFTTLDAFALALRPCRRFGARGSGFGFAFGLLMTIAAEGETV